jgi:single-stranded DNA-specific DHH superfamily exonuclease
MTTEQEDDPFESFDSAASIMAFYHLHFGEEGLRELLAMMGAVADREYLEREARELAAIGLADVAAIVSEAAIQTPEAG